MKTRTVSMLALGALLCAVVPELAAAQEPTTVPEVVQVEDPAGDANYLNGLPGGEDQTTPADLTVSDILKVWFTHDPTNIAVHILTEGPPPSSNAAYQFRVFVNPGDDADGCQMFVATVAGPSYVGDPFAELRNNCEDVEDVPGELLVEELGDGTGVITVAVPRASHAAFADNAVLAAPWAWVQNATGPSAAFLVGPTVDNTQIGTDYTITPADDGSEEPPPGCTKGKGKKKGCKKRGG